MDSGDFVIVINASKVRLTGKKLSQKMYYHHSGYQGGLRQLKQRNCLKKNRKRCSGLLCAACSKNTLGRMQLRKLKIYPGESHPHQAQKPEAHQL